jgi:rare lipoprotein A (peptidoglycan hydrolase)
MKRISILLFLVLVHILHARGEDNYSLRRIDDRRRVYTGKPVKKKEPSAKVNINKDMRAYSSAVSFDRYPGVYKVGRPYEIFGKMYYPKEDVKYVKEGMASWYGLDFHNKRTANGEIYDMNDYTAAHNTLPMPSIVRVTNLNNGRSVNVRVNDRGPFAKDRIIDVSKKVAHELGFHEKGTTRVRVEYLKEESDELLQKLGLYRR